MIATPVFLFAHLRLSLPKRMCRMLLRPLVASDKLVPRTVYVTSAVTMRHADLEEIRVYAATGESLDKAGGYAAQGEGRRFIERIDGSETNVIGLPLDETLLLLGEAGFRT